MDGLAHFIWDDPLCFWLVLVASSVFRPSSLPSYNKWAVLHSEYNVPFMDGLAHFYLGWHIIFLTHIPHNTCTVQLPRANCPLHNVTCIWDFNKRMSGLHNAQYHVWVCSLWSQLVMGVSLILLHISLKLAEHRVCPWLCRQLKW
jgi:hypothetical protein